MPRDVRSLLPTPEAAEAGDFDLAVAAGEAADDFDEDGRRVYSKRQRKQVDLYKAEPAPSSFKTSIKYGEPEPPPLKAKGSSSSTLPIATPLVEEEERVRRRTRRREEDMDAGEPLVYGRDEGRTPG